MGGSHKIFRVRDLGFRHVSARSCIETVQQAINLQNVRRDR